MQGSFRELTIFLLILMMETSISLLHCGWKRKEDWFSDIILYVQNIICWIMYLKCTLAVECCLEKEGLHSWAAVYVVVFVVVAFVNALCFIYIAGLVCIVACCFILIFCCSYVLYILLSSCSFLWWSGC